MDAAVLAAGAAEDAVRALRPAFDRVFLVGPAGPDRRPWLAVAAALRVTRKDGVFVVGGDRRGLDPGLAVAVAEAMPGWDAVVPVWNGRLEPLFAAYSTRCLPALESLSGAEPGGLKEVFARVRTRFFLEDEVRRFDPSGRSFLALAGHSAARTAWTPAVKSA